MLKRITTVLLFGGLLGLVPAAAQAAPPAPAEVTQAGSEPAAAGYDLFHKDRDDDHYRCMYRCDDRRYHKHKHKHRYHHKQRYCWYRDRWGWHQARCGRHHHHH